jgi:hypothetical protein
MDKTSLERLLGRYPYSVISTNIAAAALAIIIGWLCIEVGDSEQEQVLNGLLSILGALIGWALGMFFAPYTSDEASRFSTISQGISAFLSGYVVSKLDRFLEATMFTTTETAGTTVEAPTTVTWVRIGLFTCSVLLVMLTVFTNRAYFRPAVPLGGDTLPQTPPPTPDPELKPDLSVRSEAPPDSGSIAAGTSTATSETVPAGANATV